MERSILAEGDNQGDTTPISKSTRSLIKIDSISIDLVNGNEKTDVGKCEHFSIRGFVAEIRKKDKNKSCPFSLDDKCNNSEGQICMLPPLHVAKFRWWRCQNCLREIDGKGAAKEIGMVPNCCNTGFKASSTYSHMSSHGDHAAMLPLDFQQASKLDNSVGGKADANTSADVNSDEHCLPSCNDKEDKKAGVAHTTIMGHENGSKDNVNQEISISTCGATKFNPCLIWERHTDDTVLKSKCNGFVESCKPNSGNHEVADNVLGHRNLKHSSADIGQTEKEISIKDQHKEVITECGTSGVGGEVNSAFVAGKGHTSEHSSLELDTHDYASSEGDEIFVGNNLQDHRKSRKVRFLTELLGAHGNSSGGHTEVEDAPSNTSAGVDLVSVPKVHEALQGNVPRGFRGQNRKRKMLHDDDWRSPEMSCPKNVNKKVRIFKGDVETTTNANASSKPEEDASAGIGLQAGSKKHWTKHGIDGGPILSKKKAKKIQIDDGNPLEEVVHLPKQNQAKIGDVDKGGTSDIPSTHDAFRGRVMDPLLKIFLPPQRTEKKSSLGKKKNKMPQIENTQASLMPWNNAMLIESQISRQNVEIMQTGPQTIPFQSVQDAALGKGPYLSLESYLAAPRNNRINSILPWQEGMFREDQIMRKDVGIKHLGDSTVPLKSATSASIEKGVQCNLNTKRTALRTSLISEKKNCTPLMEDGDCSLKRKMDFFGPSNNEKAVGVQEHSEVINKHIDQRADKVFEQGALDDIPMEIVELMAKNQYERRLHDTENKHCLLETTSKPRNGETKDFTKLYGHGALRLLQEENTHLQKAQLSNARKNIFTTSEHVGSSKQKSFSYIPLMGQPEGTLGSRGFGACSLRPEKLSSGVRCSASGSSRHSSAQNGKWDRDTYGHRSSPTSLQAFNAYDTCQTVSQQSEKAAGVWSSMIPNHMPYGINIPQNCVAPSINIDMLSQLPGTLSKGKMNGDHDLKILNLNVANLEKQNRNFGPETFHKTHTDYSYVCNHKGIELHPKLMGSLDMYSNETIPAMHLLSLMDAGMRSSTPFNMDGSTKFLKRPSFPHDHHSNEFSELDLGVHKTSHTSGHPSSDNYRKTHLKEKSCECFPAVPTVGAVTSSFQNDVNFRSATGFTGQVPLKAREKGKAKSSYSPTQNRGCISQTSVSTSVNLGRNCESIPVHDMQKSFLGASDFMVRPSQSLTLEDLRKRTELEAYSSYGTVWPVKSCSETEICSVNRNPADFSMPEAGNVYTIGAEDLKFGKKICSGDGSGLISVDGHKQQRIMKLTAVKGRARRRIS